MIYINLILIKPFSERPCLVGGGGVILEETTPIGIEMFFVFQGDQSGEMLG